MYSWGSYRTGENCDDFMVGVRGRINASVRFLDENKSKGFRIRGDDLTQERSRGSLAIAEAEKKSMIQV